MIHKGLFQNKQRLTGGKILERIVKDLSDIKGANRGKCGNDNLVIIQGSNNWQKLVNGWRIYSKGIYKNS